MSTIVIDTASLRGTTDDTQLANVNNAPMNAPETENDNTDSISIEYSLSKTKLIFILAYGISGALAVSLPYILYNNEKITNKDAIMAGVFGACGSALVLYPAYRLANKYCTEFQSKTEIRNDLQTDSINHNANP